MQSKFAETGDPEEKPLLNDSKTLANKINTATYVLTNKLYVKARNAHHIYTLESQLTKMIPKKKYNVPWLETLKREIIQGRSQL